jgi:hypothetical protein
MEAMKQLLEMIAAPAAAIYNGIRRDGDACGGGEPS